MTEDELNKLVNDKIGELRNNIAFQMSLSGKELFHSNMIGVFLTQVKDNQNSKVPSELAKSLIDLFPPKIKGEDKKDYVVFDVLREKQNLDIIICYCNQKEKDLLNNNNYFCIADIPDPGKKKNNNTDEEDNSEEGVNDDKNLSTEICDALENFQYVIIENKFKSFPYREQLDKYSEKKISVLRTREAFFENSVSPKKYNFETRYGKNLTFYLLAPKNSLLSFFGKNEFKYISNSKEKAVWFGKSYEELKETLSKHNKSDDTDLMRSFIDEYCKFLTIMIELYDICIESRLKQNKYSIEPFTKKCFLSAEHNGILLKGRVQDFYEKIIFNRVLCDLQNESPELFPKNSDSKDPKLTTWDEPFFHSSASYTNQTGLLDFRYVWGDSNITAGIQIQGGSLEIVFSAERSIFKTVFGVSKYTKVVKEFIDKSDKERNVRLTIDEFSKKEEIEKTISCIIKIYKKIKEKYPKLELKKPNRSEIYSYIVKDQYTYRYLSCNLNTLVPNAKYTYTGQEYRELEYDTLKELIKYSLSVIADENNRYEKLREEPLESFETLIQE